jgi:hypothetical protein
MLFLGLLYSCEKNNEKDNSDKSSQNQVTYDNREYLLHKGFIEHYRENLFALNILSSGLDIDSDGDFFNSIIGNGYAVYFEIYTDNFDSISNGTYNFDIDESGEEFTFGFGKVVLNWDVSEPYSDDYDLANGSIQIEKEDDTYTISWQGKGENGIIISGYYKGALEYFDEKKENQITIGDSVVELTKGCLDNNGTVSNEPNSSVAMILSLTNDGISITTDNDGNVDYAGNAFLTQIALYTSNETELDQIEYTYGADYTYEVGTFDGVVFNKWDSNLDIYQSAEINSGTIVVKKTESEYEISINCKDDSNNAIIGYYKGELPIY